MNKKLTAAAIAVLSLTVASCDEPQPENFSCDPKPGDVTVIEEMDGGEPPRMKLYDGDGNYICGVMG